MANIVKKVDRNIPPQMRTQTFTEADATNSDIILVRDSLGKPASHVQIEAAADLTIRLNVRHIVYPRRGLNSGLADMQLVGPNTAQGREYIDRSQSTLFVAAGDTLTFDQDVAIEDIEIVTAVGAYTIITA